jgi:hypothetical protein
VLVVPVTVGVKVCALPKSKEAVAGVRVTLTEDGAGKGGGGCIAEELVTALPQPRAHPLMITKTRVGHARKCRGRAS